MEIYTTFPTDEKSASEWLRGKRPINRLRELCEQAEIGTSSKLFDAQAVAYKFQLLTYLIQNELPLAKYLWKRLPAELKNPNLASEQQDTAKGRLFFADYYAKFRAHASEIQALWTIGQCMWREDFANVAKNINGFKWSSYLKPFVGELEREHRQRMVELVNQAYTSISMKELAETYLGGTLDSTTVKDIEALVSQQDNWTIDPKDKQVIVIAHNKRELPLDVNMLNDMTEYVCLMEAQQSLGIDKMAPAEKIQ
ncbi:hypothetical protein RFI_10593 [Reticulomyxa filosa]|uniref:CSN8/PSMD8/EIF3K domain-containing protein n=1 Tax=Reticulomyxa filosa TaxID=46433 RepID=X6NLF6_RETFI|nr:hypothetical protein RFI_10593 [Reticulomyxa filosa]|eukprot:ETO26544.1 hypothetical protein RFI_10593 [Reticulomyxa filosa]